MKIKYPKLIILLLTFVLAYFIFAGREMLAFKEILGSLGYFGTFITGIMFAYGFTAGPATAIFLILGSEQNIILAGIIGGFGALCGNYITFKIIRKGFNDELERLKKEKFIMKINGSIPHRLAHILIVVFAGLIIASPLPDEIGVSIIALDRKIPLKLFTLISFTLSTAGILIILWIGSALA